MDEIDVILTEAWNRISAKARRSRLLVIVQVPPFEQMGGLPLFEQKLGRPLTPAEVEVQRNRAPAIAVTREQAERLGKARA